MIRAPAAEQLLPDSLLPAALLSDSPLPPDHTLAPHPWRQPSLQFHPLPGPDQVLQDHIWPRLWRKLAVWHMVSHCDDCALRSLTACHTDSASALPLAIDSVLLLEPLSLITLLTYLTPVISLILMWRTPFPSPPRCLNCFPTAPSAGINLKLYLMCFWLKELERSCSVEIQSRLFVQDERSWW